MNLANEKTCFFLIKWKVLIYTVFNILIISLFSFLIIRGYKFNIWIPLFIVTLMLYYMLFTLPFLLRSIKLVLRNQPAVVLSKSNFIDNLNQQVYKWHEIKDISYHAFTSPRAYGGYISINLKTPEKFINNFDLLERLRIRFLDKKQVFALSANTLNCSNVELIKNIKKYHIENK